MSAGGAAPGLGARGMGPDPGDEHLDERLMDLALDEARRGVGRTSPNPAVGCLIVRDGAVVARGWHRRAGADHAEVDALRQLGMRADGATAYVTLEPCNHTGRTGPCAEALIAAGVRRVVIGATDPNPQVAGGGADRLRAAGVDVVVGVREGACRQVIAPFARWVTTGLPWLLLKQAATLDGYVGDGTGVPRAISGVASHARVHLMRDQADAILVGVGTVLADDPRLTTRLTPPAEGRDPVRVVLDSRLRMPAEAAMLRSGSPSATLVLTAADPATARGEALARAGAEVVRVGAGPDGVDLGAALRELGRRGLVSVLVEAGPTLAAALLRAGLVSRVSWFLAPLILGAKAAPRMVGDLAVSSLEGAQRLGPLAVSRSGEDVLIEADIAQEDPCSPGSSRP